jgi:uncharacterized protein DUF3443
MGANETRLPDSRRNSHPRPSAGDSANGGGAPASAVAGAMCAAMLLFTMLLSSCGGGSSSSPSTTTSTANSVGLGVEAGPTGSCTNCLFTNVTVCVPGTATCQVIDHVLVDTGSFGLRVVSSGATPAGGELSLSLNQQTSTGGTPIAECVEFADSFTWGPVATVDVEIAGEKATSVPIQVIGDPSYSTVPNTSNCGASGLPASDDVSALGANGILGVGVFTDDCGCSCANTCQPSVANPGVYFACPTPLTCAVTTEAEANQLQNPVWMFATDNNGLSISLPNIPPPGLGAANESGTLTFGIGTQSNNGLGNATVYTTDPITGNFTTQYKGVNYTESFLDTGSGALFFLDPATTGISGCPTTCSTAAGTIPLTGLYCPSVTANQSATNVGQNGNSGTVSIIVSSASTLLCGTSNFAFSDLAGTFTTPVLGFDWGLNFFYGKTVFVAIDGQTTPAGTGPYWAY